jgi:hypothetical protein
LRGTVRTSEMAFTRMELRCLYILRAFHAHEIRLPQRVLTLTLTFLSGERIGKTETGNLVTKLVKRGLANVDKDDIFLTAAGSTAIESRAKDLSQLDRDRIDGGAKEFLSRIDMRRK